MTTVAQLQELPAQIATMVAAKKARVNYRPSVHFGMALRCQDVETLEIMLRISQAFVRNPGDFRNWWRARINEEL